MWQLLQPLLSGSYDVVRTIEKYGVYIPKKNSFTLEIKRKGVFSKTSLRFNPNARTFCMKCTCVLIET